MTVSSVKVKEEVLLNALTTALESAGYRQDVEVRWGSAKANWWFSRRRDGVTEAVAARVRWNPEPFMVIDCVGSFLTLPELASKGLEDNAAAFNLFNFQVLVLKRPVEDLLPRAISLDTAGSGWPEFAQSLSQRIAFELASVEATIWSRIRKSLQE